MLYLPHDAVGPSKIAGDVLTDTRRGKNDRHGRTRACGTTARVISLHRDPFCECHAACLRQASGLRRARPHAGTGNMLHSARISIPCARISIPLTKNYPLGRYPLNGKESHIKRRESTNIHGFQALKRQ